MSRFTGVPSGVKSRTVATSLKIWALKSDSSINGHISSLHGIYSPLSSAAGKKEFAGFGHSMKTPSSVILSGIPFISLHTNKFFSTLTIGAFLFLLSFS